MSSFIQEGKEQRTHVQTGSWWQKIDGIHWLSIMEGISTWSLTLYIQAAIVSLTFFFFFLKLMLIDLSKSQTLNKY